jgi:hypothetical protein
LLSQQLGGQHHHLSLFRSLFPPLHQHHHPRQRCRHHHRHQCSRARPRRGQAGYPCSRWYGTSTKLQQGSRRKHHPGRRARWSGTRRKPFLAARKRYVSCSVKSCIDTKGKRRQRQRQRHRKKWTTVLRAPLDFDHPTRPRKNAREEVFAMRETVSRVVKSSK